MQDFSDRRIRTQEITPEPYQLYRREEKERTGQDPPTNEDRILRDFDYFKGMYPAEAKRLQLSVDAVVDEMEYEGSPIYDEFPDRVMLEQLIRRAAERAGMSGAEVTAEEIHVSYGPVGDGARLWENGAVFSQEMENRRPWDRMPPPRPNPPWRPSNQPPGQNPPWGPPHQPPGPNPPWGPPRPRPPRPPEPNPPWRPPTGSNPPWGPPGPPPRPMPPRNQWDLLSILLMHELQRRRCRNGRCR